MALTNQQIGLVIGIRATGDLGPFTLWTDRRGNKAWCLKAWLKDPASPSQAAQRTRFKAAMKAWRRLTDERKTSWWQACEKLNLRVTGCSLWVHWYLKHDDSVIETIELQSGLTLLPPEYKE